MGWYELNGRAKFMFKCYLEIRRNMLTRNNRQLGISIFIKKQFRLIKYLGLYRNTTALYTSLLTECVIKTDLIYKVTLSFGKKSIIGWLA